MPIKIMVPASTLANLKNKELVIDYPERCSRCNNPVANHYESHRLLYRVAFNKTRISGNKYKVAKNYTLKIRVCENCYLSDYITHPDKLKRDNTHQGHIARFQAICMSIGGLMAAAGFILLTPFVPNTPFFENLKNMWQVPIGAGIVVLLLAWLSQRKHQNQVSNRLDHAGFDYHSFLRSETHTPILSEHAKLTEIGLELKLNNEEWAKEAAKNYNWDSESMTGSEKLDFEF